MIATLPLVPICTLAVDQKNFVVGLVGGWHWMRLIGFKNGRRFWFPPFRKGKNELCMIWVLWHLPDGSCRSLNYPADNDQIRDGYPKHKKLTKISVLYLDNFLCFIPWCFLVKNDHSRSFFTSCLSIYFQYLIFNMRTKRPNLPF